MSLSAVASASYERNLARVMTKAVHWAVDRLLEPSHARHQPARTSLHVKRPFRMHS